MNPRTRITLVVATAVLIEGILALNIAWPYGVDVDEGEWGWVAGLTSFPVAAALLMAYRPNNRVCWALSISAVSAGLLFLMGWYGWQFRDAPFSREVEALGKIPSVVQLASMFALLHLFPTGKLISRGFARIFRLHLAGFAVVGLLATISPSPLAVTGRPNPFALLPESMAEVADGGGILIAPFAVTGIVSLLLRWRQAGLAERAQIKWFLAGGAFCVAILMGAFFLPGEDSTGSNFVDGATTLLVVAAFWALPAAVVVAVLRYRLYDIDLVINRALVYGALTVGTIATYLGLVVAGSSLARLLSGQESNEVVVAATTLIVAALFQPARRRIQSLVDRRFYRSRYDAGRIVEAFQARLRDQPDIDAVRSELAEATHLALRPSSVNVWIRPGVARNDLVARHPYGEGTP